jgi:hypothetical protein
MAASGGTLGALVMALISGALLTIRPNLPFVAGGILLAMTVVVMSFGFYRNQGNKMPDDRRGSA